MNGSRPRYPTFARQYTYDVRGRVLNVGVLATGMAATNAYVYDLAGNVVARTDAEGRASGTVYDDFGRAIAVVDALGHTNSFEYDAQGNLTKLIDANGNETAFAYDLNGLLTNKTYADASALVYSYDALGNLTNRLDAKGQRIEYGYDILGRIVTNAFHASTNAGAAARTVAFGYDVYGRMISYSDGTTSGTFVYDDTNRTRTAMINFGPFSKTCSYAFDALGRKTAFTGADGNVIHYAYTLDDQLSSVTITNEGTITYSYDRYGLPVQAVLPGGNTKRFGYDGMFNLTTNQALDPAGNPIMSRTYARNRVGNIIGQAAEYGDYIYQYDDADQLVGLAISNYTGPAGLPTNEWFNYDAMGNRLSSSGGMRVVASTYGANVLNQYTQVVWVADGTTNTLTYTYDLNGNQLSHYQFTSNGIVTNTLVWDIEDRLAAVLDAGSNVVAQYYYDPFGRRLSKTVFSGGASNTTYFLYADEGLVAEYDSIGAEVRVYAYAPDSLWMNGPLYLRTFHVTPSTFYFLTDHLGAPQKLVDAAGGERWGLVQEAFGDAVIEPGSSVESPLRFSSQYEDAESGLHYNTMRYYSGILGRYLSRDPAGTTDDALLYGFLGNSAVSANDPLGLCKIYVLIGHGSPAYAPQVVWTHTPKGPRYVLKRWPDLHLSDREKRKGLPGDAAWLPEQMRDVIRTMDRTCDKMVIISCYNKYYNDAMVNMGVGLRGLRGTEFPLTAWVKDGKGGSTIAETFADYWTGGREKIIDKVLPQIRSTARKMQTDGCCCENRVVDVEYRWQPDPVVSILRGLVEQKKEWLPRSFAPMAPSAGQR